MTADAREPMKNRELAAKITREHAALYGGPSTPVVTVSAIRAALDAKDANVKALVKAARAYAKHETVYYLWKLEEVLAAFPEEQ